MHFKFEKNGKLVKLIIYKENEPTILEELVIKKRTYIKNNKPKSKQAFIDSMNIHVKAGDASSCEDFHNKYCDSMNNKIESEAREIAKCFLRIEQARECIDLSQSIQFSDTDYYKMKNT